MPLLHATVPEPAPQGISAPRLDLTGLREITAGDVALERALFDEFIRAGQMFLMELSSSLPQEASENWRKTAHAFKGVAFNLGAMALGEWCKRAQEGCTKDETVKQALLLNIQHEFEALLQHPSLQ